MNCWDGIHWNINEILPYQRNFNFLISQRRTGKTYTVQMYTTAKCIENNQQFIYVCRTESELNEGLLQDAYLKVLMKEFPGKEFSIDKKHIYYLEPVGEDKKGKTIYNKILIGYGIALSSVYKMKKKSFPLVKYIIFDEYTIEFNSKSSYVDGWKEPERFLNLYDTVDRNEDRVICFFMGNTLDFYNPYHIHPVFKLKNVNIGEIWTNKFCLFQRIKPSEKLMEYNKKSKFSQMIEGSQYGKMANEGIYTEDNEDFIASMPAYSQYSMTFSYMGDKYGVWADKINYWIVISNKINPSYKRCYALTPKDHKEDTIYGKKNQVPHIKWLGDQYKQGRVRYENMEIKTKLGEAMVKLL